ncbi:hypothetical protein L249_0402 [Ophiocordyceps polyrhachis-furcata BCC 54312]|uniref:Methyltransferase domain-containing protein n=1 Tax=Ophiocordyceps polyrhachis-furcata BCC 54312 TaxID=1330021 RepID=A0A367LFH2_9HYPO|nr:hypothetical protein L249_0402 [Ophiocordyceps polyrhachis-furcata BCC 54312]
MASSIIPRMHLFEIDDQPWFPAFLRKHVQDILTMIWATNPLGTASAADHAASVLVNEFGNDLTSYTLIDFCAGAGGPTPIIEQVVNRRCLRERGLSPVDFILTDLHPNQAAWEEAARGKAHLSYESSSVDASAVPAHLVRRQDGKRVLRLFNLAFHHFDDHLARRILRDTMETNQGFVIFELQDRSIATVMTILLMGVGIFFAMPLYAWKRRSITMLVFTYLVPILPFVVVFDGFISALRTRTPREVELLLRSCGGGDADKWEIRSRSDRFLFPCGYLNWIICRPVKSS